MESVLLQVNKELVDIRKQRHIGIITSTLQSDQGNEFYNKHEYLH